MRVVKGLDVATCLIETLPVLYSRDETAWLEAMALLICEGRLRDLDYPNLREYLEDMARRDKREVESRLAVLIAHLLKWTHQSERRSGSWRATIEVQRHELTLLLQSATLRNYAESVLPDTYIAGVRQAVAETGLPTGTFPLMCPYSLEQLEAIDAIE